MITCLICKEKFQSPDDLYLHIEEDHGDDIPKNYSAAQYYYFIKTNKTHGSCVVCKGKTEWNDKTNKYHRFCSNPKCKEAYIETFKKNMIGKHGKTTLLNDPDHQRKMLANRAISGIYEWSDGTHKNYTGSYELDFLKFLDKFMEFDSTDVMCPSPHTYYYMYDGEKKFYIPDIFINSLNLEIEIKDGGDNPNNHGKIQAVDKIKEKLKDGVLKSQKEFNYIKIVNKQYKIFLDYLELAKKNFLENKDELIFMMENVTEYPTMSALNKEYLTEKIYLVTYRDTTYNDLEVYDTGYRGVFNKVCLSTDKSLKNCFGIDSRGLYNIPLNSNIDYMDVDYFEVSSGTISLIIDTFNKLSKLDDIKYSKKPKGSLEFSQASFIAFLLSQIPSLRHEIGDNIESYKIVDLRTIKGYDQAYSGSMEGYFRAFTIPNEVIKNEAVTESNDSNEVLQPVYILLTYTKSAMAKAIKLVTGEKYSHCGISFNGDLSHIYTFGRKELDSPLSFIDENIYSGALGQKKDDIDYALYVKFVTAKQKEIMQSTLDIFKSNSEKLRYSYRGLINIAMNKETHDKDSYFCSQFVAEILRSSNSVILDKDTSLYTPSQLASLSGMYKLSEGKLGELKPRSIYSKMMKIRDDIILTENVTISLKDNSEFEFVIERCVMENDMEALLNCLHVDKPLTTEVVNSFFKRQSEVTEPLLLSILRTQRNNEKVYQEPEICKINSGKIRIRINSSQTVLFGPTDNSTCISFINCDNNTTTTFICNGGSMSKACYSDNPAEIEYPNNRVDKMFDASIIKPISELKDTINRYFRIGVRYTEEQDIKRFIEKQFTNASGEQMFLLSDNEL